MAHIHDAESFTTGKPTPSPQQPPSAAKASPAARVVGKVAGSSLRKAFVAAPKRERDALRAEITKAALAGLFTKTAMPELAKAVLPMITKAVESIEEPFERYQAMHTLGFAREFNMLVKASNTTREAIRCAEIAAMPRPPVRGTHRWRELERENTADRVARLREVATNATDPELAKAYRALADRIDQAI